MTKIESKSVRKSSAFIFILGDSDLRIIQVLAIFRKTKVATD